MTHPADTFFHHHPSAGVLPAFDKIRPSDIEPAITALIADARRALETVTAADFPADWVQIARVLDVATERLSMAWGAVGHLSSVADTPELRTAHNAMLGPITQFWTELGANVALFEKYQAIDRASLNAQQRRALDLTLRSFELSGAKLTGAARERFIAIEERMAQLSQKFSENTLDATDGFSYLATAEEMAGIPADVCTATAAAAAADGITDGRHKLTLKMPCYLPVMQFAKSSALRQRLYRAYVTRASECAQGFADNPAVAALDNTPIIGELLALRQEQAELLGCADFAALSLIPKMAANSQEVTVFLRDLAARAKPWAERDVAEMRRFAAEHLQLSNPQPWDWAFIAEQLRQHRYAFSEDELKQYFPAPRVLDGLFALAQRLFDVQITPDVAPTWHADVQFFTLRRGERAIGHFYLDPKARTGKRGGAWMDDVRSRWQRPDTGTLQTPIAHMVCNFADAVGGRPALLTHDDVITLFHEMGHALHHLLTQVDERDIAGISGVEWDAVELPSQFMENFCWEWQTLQDLTAHVDTGQPLPRELFDKITAAKNFQAGMGAMRQIEFALFDMLLHGKKDKNATTHFDYLKLLENVRAEVAVLPTVPYNRSPNTFSHIFAGGYAAGYYSYKWAEVLSADAYAAFEEARENTQNPANADLQTGQRYLREILERGASRTALDNFTAFRGRAPSIDALLRHQGMSGTPEPLAA